jgi:hypothetical protein
LDIDGGPPKKYRRILKDEAIEVKTRKGPPFTYRVALDV